jgi:hypothetical protein
MYSKKRTLGLIWSCIKLVTYFELGWWPGFLKSSCAIRKKAFKMPRFHLQMKTFWLQKIPPFGLKMPKANTL